MSGEAFDPDWRVCAVCARPLDRAVGGGYLHIIDVMQGIDDHPVVPVPLGEVHVVGVCDFCYGPDPTFAVPVADFTYANVPAVVLGDGRPRRQSSVGGWAACAPCAVLVSRDDWNGLIRRKAALDSRLRNPEVRAELAGVFRQVSANITGPIRLFEFPQPNEDQS